MRKSLFSIAVVVALLALLPAEASAARRITFGVHTPHEPLNGNTTEINSLQRDLGRRINVVSWFQNWGGDEWANRPQPSTFNAVRRSPRRRAMITWEPWVPKYGSNEERTGQPQYALSRILAGDHDDYIRSWARALAAQRSVVYLRMMHEMNGDWYPWGGTVNGNSPAQFRAAWRKIVTMFRLNGAHNVRFIFCPMGTSVPDIPANRIKSYWPGRRYVDIIGLDGYNWGATRPEWGGWKSFRKTFRKAYRRVKRLGPQPIWIAEVGSVTEGGDKAAWVRGMWRTARRWKRLRGIVWMNTVSANEGDWRLRSPANVASAFRVRRR